MKDFKSCSNGHYYKIELDSCPHCPIGSDQPDSNNSESNEMNKTQFFGDGGAQKNHNVGNADNDKTQVFGTEMPTGASSKSQSKRDFDKTYIGVNSEQPKDGQGPITEKPRAVRKISGWLISFTIDPMGVDYRIYEGSNSIGRDLGNTISIATDSTISGNHAIILHRSGKFWIEDAMTSNGTSVNGVELEPRKAYDLKDGDEVKLGDTVFIFKTWH